MQLNLRTLTFSTREDDTQDFVLEVDSEDYFPTPASSGMEVDPTGPTLWCNFRSESGSEVNRARFSFSNRAREFNFRFHMKDSPAADNPFGHFNKRRRDKEDQEHQVFELGKFTLSRIQSYTFDLSLELTRLPTSGPNYGILSLEIIDNNIIVNLAEVEGVQSHTYGREVRINFENISDYSIKCKWEDGKEDQLGKISLHHN